MGIPEQGSAIPKVGETVKIVKTLYGGNDPTDPWGNRKIRIYPPTIVRVEGTRTKTLHNPVTKEVESRLMVRLVNIKTSEEYPEVKIGALLHAAGLVEEDDLEGRGLFFDDELHSVSEGFEQGSPFSVLEGLKTQMEAEAEAKLTALADPERVHKLARALPAPHESLAQEGMELRVLGRLESGYCKVAIEGRQNPIFLPEDDLVAAIA